MLIWTSRNIPNVGLFSAYAEVFPDNNPARALCLYFSLPTQRCFHYLLFRGEPNLLFSAYAEVFPAPSASRQSDPAFLCLRRGVSSEAPALHFECDFSLPTQRCFPSSPRPQSLERLFSAYAEVFPTHPIKTQGSAPFLCLRRGVSVPTALEIVVISFSLPTQRCFFYG